MQRPTCSTTSNIIILLFLVLLWTNIQCGQEIFELGRDEHSYLRIGHGRVENLDPMFYDGYHYMHVLGGNEDFEVHFLLVI